MTFRDGVDRHAVAGGKAPASTGLTCPRPFHRVMAPIQASHVLFEFYGRKKAGRIAMIRPARGSASLRTDQGAAELI